MTRRGAAFVLAALALAAGMLASPAAAKVKLPVASTGAGPAAATPVTIGYLGLDNDPRHAALYANTHIELAPADDPTQGAQMGIEDSSFIASAAGIELALDVERAADVAGLMADLKAMAGNGERFVLLDLPGDLAAEVARQAEALRLTLINISAPDNALRSSCEHDLLDTAASDRQLTDALAQFLRTRNWTRVLVLVGGTDRDKAFAQSFADSARRLRLSIVDTRSFSVRRNPSEREQNDTLLVTGGIDYDVVFVADSEREFARTLRYETQLPRPVIGSAGLTPLAWHWAWDRNGAPQVQHRFLALSRGRHMTSADWAAWIAVKSIVDAYSRAGSLSSDAVDAYLRSPDLASDGSKGLTQNYRPWSGQMRQPILLATDDAVIDAAPLPGFEHQTNTLDTLGEDRPESKCP
jgi:ABC transporter substrate binding protein (PQQ-dependent alcohol dehydrogenase system)